jgi:hypothetical protein
MGISSEFANERLGDSTSERLTLRSRPPPTHTPRWGMGGTSTGKTVLGKLGVLTPGGPGKDYGRLLGHTFGRSALPWGRRGNVSAWWTAPAFGGGALQESMGHGCTGR